MFEELIMRLREAPYDWPDADLHYEAADAIEELSRLHEAQRQNLITLMNEDPEMEWIPVTERLPEEPYGCLAIVWDNPRYDGDMFLNYYPEFVGWDGETWNDADGEEIPFDVVYWMKMPQIPEPPKEGE